ncbi:hypothetical protein P152DRAFT_202717 [Eremomyces bilateralis CBS 781.70]|uniref:STE24 endopeptidase n=1 Tax=Eremomyces bilateralis CBS 781.70 TaxID=1392243 RepID=A0A6G1GDF6_9PEZI|nr:uncharacterized protein P152DRAFT_202717 [Eremomyces bilateralis CBS 781.70]KAF1815946.1 hypothetical protein P152DRAFT_202717 [Eremomyces bilateralis CBS 781.70]
MPTLLDRALQSRGALLTFSGIITAVAAFTILGGSSIFPPESDPTGDPNDWTETDLKRWLNNRNLKPNDKASREELIERVRANMRPATRPS